MPSFRKYSLPSGKRTSSRWASSVELITSARFVCSNNSQKPNARRSGLGTAGKRPTHGTGENRISGFLPSLTNNFTHLTRYLSQTHGGVNLKTSFPQMETRIKSASVEGCSFFGENLPVHLTIHQLI